MEQNVRYPNLELLEYKAWKLISEKYGYTGNTRTLYRNCSADMFQQIWPDTLAGLRSSEEQIARRQLTPEYTTVMHLKWQIKGDNTDYEEYVIFFGQIPAYSVTDANKAFLEDLKDRNMASLLDAKDRY